MLSGVAIRITRTPTRWRTCAYHSGGFTGGFTSSVPHCEPTKGPLAKTIPGRVKVTPRMLKQHLDRFVVGQDRSKRILATAVYHHYQRVRQIQKQQEERERELFRQSQMALTAEPREDEFIGMDTPRPPPSLPPVIDSGPGNETDLADESPLTIEKSNVLCLGPTGVGKTLMVRTLAKVLDVPFSMSDCTPFTMAGYVGEDVDQAVHRLLIAANYDVRRAETGIICLDEFDKIAKPKAIHGTKDISGEGVQQALLKIIEGTTLQIHTKPQRPQQQMYPTHPSTPSGFNPPNPGISGSSGPPGGNPKGETVTIDTSSILFIFTGAFIGLDKIISDRIDKGSMGFNATVRSANQPPFSDTQFSHSSGHGNDPQSFLPLIEPSDLINFGIIPEMVGRIPVTTAVEPLTEEMLVRVLTEPKNALLRQYESLFALGGVELCFTSPALREIAKSALKMGTGARGLRTVVEKLLSDAMFETPAITDKVDDEGTSVKHVLVNEAAAKGKQAPGYFSRGQQQAFQAMAAAEEEAWERRGGKPMVRNPPLEDGDAQRAVGYV